jgi:hypothetical protein
MARSGVGGDFDTQSRVLNAAHSVLARDRNNSGGHGGSIGGGVYRVNVVVEGRDGEIGRGRGF